MHITKPRASLFVAAIVMGVSASPRAFAQTSPGDSAATDVIRQAVPVGTAILVEDSAGRRLKARFQEWEGDILVVTTEGRTPMTRPFTMNELRTVRRDDSQMNGFWIGFGVGAVPGIVLGSLFSRRCENEGSRPCPAAMALFGVLTGLGGGGLGAGIDGTFRRGPVIFSRSSSPGSSNTVDIAPLLDPVRRGSGLALSLRF